MAATILQKILSKFNCVKSNRSNSKVHSFTIIRFSHINGNLKTALSDYNDIKLAPYRIGACTFGDSFENAHVQVMQYLKNDSGKLVRPLYAPVREIIRKNIFTYCVDFRSIFDRGFKTLENYIMGRNVSSGSDQNKTGDHKRVLESINFLSAFMNRKDFHAECLEVMFFGPADYNFQNVEEGSKVNEGDVAILLANHLFSQLALNNKEIDQEKYIVNRDIKNKKRFCPCSMMCGAEISYGNTLFGSEYLWYGHTDIMVFPTNAGACSIIVPPKRDYTDEQEREPEDAERWRNDEKSHVCTIRDYNNIRQIVSQAVTFSLYQKKYQKLNNLPVCDLIPTIAASKDFFDIYMYDAENDILLRNVGEPIPIFRDNKFNISAIIQIWMLINYTSFSPTLSEEAVDKLHKSCGLQRQLIGMDENSLQIIMKTLKMKEKIVPKIDPDFNFVHAELIGPSMDSAKKVQLSADV